MVPYLRHGNTLFKAIHRRCSELFILLESTDHRLANFGNVSGLEGLTDSSLKVHHTMQYIMDGRRTRRFSFGEGRSWELASSELAQRTTSSISRNVQ